LKDRTQDRYQQFKNLYDTVTRLNRIGWLVFNIRFMISTGFDSPSILGLIVFLVAGYSGGCDSK